MRKGTAKDALSRLIWADINPTGFQRAIIRVTDRVSKSGFKDISGSDVFLIRGRTLTTHEGTVIPLYKVVLITLDSKVYWERKK
jgi:uncharacterized protein (UPF0248 family)